MKTLLPGIFFLFALLNFSCGQSKIGQNHQNNKTEKLDELISTYAEYGDFNGAVVVAEKGEILYQKAFGFADMEWDIPNQTDTKFRIASITKQFTAMLIVQLVSENKLALDEPISSYLPEYPKENGDRITIHQLLTHTSGTPEFPSKNETKYRTEEKLKLIGGLPLRFIPGERFEYSNSGYVVLGNIIEKITGKSFEKVLQEKIFTPLNMTHSGYDQHRPIIKNRASGYIKSWGTYKNAKPADMTSAYSAGGIYSTVEDMYLWDQALYTEQLLPKKYMDLVFTKHIPDPGYGGHYGYGWELGEKSIGNTNEKVETISHDGVIDGFCALFTRIPSSKASIILLCNTRRAALNAMTKGITGILYDKPYDAPLKSVALSLSEVIEKEGMAKGLSHFEEIKYAAGYFLVEKEMIGLGYNFLQSGKVEDGAAIFKLSTEAFPNSFNPFDSYGEALMTLGKKAEAIEAYKKSVALNPGNQNGLKMLEKLGVNIESMIYKVSSNRLRLLEDDYKATNQEWKVNISLVDGILVFKDEKYQYDLFPIDKNTFVNQDFGASLVFDTKDKNSITFVFNEKESFKKVE